MSFLLLESGDKLLLESGGGILLEDSVTPPVSRAITVREKPPLRLSVDLETPAGRHYRWAGDEPRPENIPTSLQFGDVMPGGFDTGECVLARKPGVGYADLVELSTFHIYGAGGEKAGEYRLERTPRVSGDQMAITPTATGWQAHLEDNKTVRVLYRDQDLSRWTEPSAQRKIALIAANDTPITGPSVAPGPNPANAVPALQLSIQGAWAPPFKPIAEALYDAGPGQGIAAIYYDLENTIYTAGWVVVVEIDSSDIQDPGRSTSLNLGLSATPAGTFVPANGPMRYARIYRYDPSTPGGADGAQYDTFAHHLAVYGDHGLTLAGAEPDAGFYDSDIVRHAVENFAPLLNVTGESIQAGGFVHEQAAYLDSTTTLEIVKNASRVLLRDWAVWDDRTFWYHDRGARGRKWRARVGPSGLSETGPQVDRLWESIVVAYNDVDGSTKTVGPPGSGAHFETGLLHDPDPDNPANQLGSPRRDLLTVSTATQNGAVEIGARFLEQSRLLDTSGQATLTGHVADDRGIVRPYWQVRSGDQIAFVDAADASYRRVVKTAKSDGDKTVQVDLDAPPEGLDALLEQLGARLQPLGIS